jgi:hypothetical protein
MNVIKQLKQRFKSDLLLGNMIASVLDNKSVDARKSYLKRACQKGDLIRIKNGLYLMGEDNRSHPYTPFQIANHLQGPSYISLESALSHYGLIPEAVYTTTSVTTRPHLEYETPIGHFSFSHLKSDYFNFGFYRAIDGRVKYLIATPLKALMDYIVLRKKNYQSIEDLQQDLRFDFDEFFTNKHFVNREKIDEMLGIYKSYRLQLILKALRKKL